MRPTEEFFGSLGPYVLVLVILLFIGFFAYTMYLRILPLVLARSEDRFRKIGKRLLGVLYFVIGQRRLFKEPGPGLMHAFIFWGFCVLLIKAITIYGMGLVTDFHLPLLGETALGHIYDLIKDIFVTLVFIAVLVALYRRLFAKPKRITLSSEANLVLILILLVVVTDLLFDSARFTLAGERPPWSPLGSTFASLYSSWNLSDFSLRVMKTVGYWGHVSVILIFLNILPYSKHFHVITSLFNVFFRNLKPKGATLKSIDFEHEEIESLGISKILDFNWKGFLDFYSCTECGRCLVNCPAYLSDKPLIPKDFICELRNHLYEEAPQLNRKKGEDNLPEIVGNVLEPAIIWSCTTCRNCEEQCPLFIEYIPKMVELRRNLVMIKADFPSELKRVFKGLETNSNPWGLGYDIRDDWAKGLDVPRWDPEHPPEYLFFVGCSGSFDDRAKKVSQSFVRLLKRAKVDFAILGQSEPCCGEVARRLGNEFLYHTLREMTINTFKELGVKKIITICPHCNTFKNEYPQVGGHYQAIHHTEFLYDLIQKGKLKIENPMEGKVVYHDPCYLGRYNDIYDIPRKLVEASMKGGLLEARRKREKALCCGGGGGLYWMEEKIGKRMNAVRLEELLETGTDKIAVSCPYCLSMFDDAVKTKDLEEKVKLFDICEILEKSLTGKEAQNGT